MKTGIIYRLLTTKYYTSCMVELALNFMVDAQQLLGRENSPDLGQYGYAGELRAKALRGVADPLVLRVMKRNFREFEMVTDICDKIEEKFREYDAKTWESLEQLYSPQRVREMVSEVRYLRRFVPQSELEDIVY